MRARKILGDPNHCSGIELSCIGEKLSQMNMVSLLQLIFDQNVIVGTDNEANDVCRERVDWVLSANKFQSGKLEAIGKELQIVPLG